MVFDQFIKEIILWFACSTRRLGFSDHGGLCHSQILLSVLPSQEQQLNQYRQKLSNNKVSYFICKCNKSYRKSKSKYLTYTKP